MLHRPDTAPQVLPLSKVPAGATIRIVQVGDCPAMRSRLLALGLTPGSTVKVDSCGCGQCCLCVRGGQLAIGHGMAEKIMVRVLDRGAAASDLACPSRPCCTRRGG
ncbi:FeoA family protein [Megalodesulfovibrio gigas]|uniref:FeoA family protein n=1 Tax=Megalodesulfovibrio gigas TaxID=879 RepID=UPI0009DC3729|nr:ferrous iron transport protein A [Megalodesulfovibrio gigas]